MPHYPQNSRVGGPQSWSEQFGEEKTFGPADSRTTDPHAHTMLTILRYFCDVYFMYVCQMIPNCHPGDNKHVRINLHYFSICTDIHIDLWFPVRGPGIPRDA